MRKEAIDSAVAFSKAGYTIFKCEGKRPQKGLKWRAHPYLMPSEVVDYLTDWDGNYGIAPNNKQLIIDLDPRNFEPGDKPHQRLFEDTGLTKDVCATVKTGGGGIHFYLSLPPEAWKKKLKKNLKAYKGIDFITNGAYVIGPGSVHPDTKKEYKLVDSTPPSAVGLAPFGLVELLTSKAKTKTTGVAVDDNAQSIARYVEYLKQAEPAVEGDSGDAVTFKVACKGRDFGLSFGVVSDLMAKEYNPRCEPPWDLEALELKVQNAYKYAQNAAGADSATADFQVLPKPPTLKQHPEWRGWDRTQTGTKKVNANNIRNFFINYHEVGKTAYTNALHHALVFNEFTGEIAKIKNMPWDRDGGAIPKYGKDWTDSDTLNLMTYLSVKYKFDATKTKVEDALVPIAELNKIHPVRDYLKAQRWDGIERLETWLLDNSGAKDDKRGVVRAVSKLMIMQAAARGLMPGCKCDTVVILEGKQGIRKSTLVEVLGGEFYADIKLNPESKDTVDGMRGKWILELSELVVYRKADVEELKSFLTRRSDRVRPAYARRTMDFPRQSIFISTLNPDATGQYLSDATGNRRFAPIDCGDKNIDVVAIDKLRNQLFAEAVFRINQGEEWHITDAKVLDALEEEQYNRQSQDTWKEVIGDWLDKHQKKFVTSEEVYLGAIGGTLEGFTIGKARRVANCLKEHDYQPSQKRVERRLVRGFKTGQYVGKGGLFE